MNTTVRLLTYNILDGGLPDRLPAIAEIIASTEPDIVALNECNRWPAEGYAPLRLIADRIGMTGAVARARSGYHQAVLTSWDIEEFANVADGMSHGFARAVLRRADGLLLTVFAAHLDPHSEDTRLAELDRLLPAMDPYRDGLCALVGDLNSFQADDWFRDVRVARAHLDHPAITQPIRCEVQPRIQAEGWIDAYRALHDDLGYTIASDDPRGRIDYAYLSPSLARCLRHCEVVRHPLEAEASDHLGLVCEFDLPTP